MSYNRRMLKEIIKKPSIPNTKKHLHALILIYTYIYSQYTQINFEGAN